MCMFVYMCVCRDYIMYLCVYPVSSFFLPILLFAIFIILFKTFIPIKNSSTEFHFKIHNPRIDQCNRVHMWRNSF